MRTLFSRMYRWVPRAAGTRRTPGRLDAPSDPPIGLGTARVPGGETDLSAPETLEMLDRPFRLETDSLETFGALDVIPRVTFAAAVVAAAGERQLDWPEHPLVSPVMSGHRRP